MLESKCILIFLALCTIIFFPNFGKCDPSSNAPEAVQDEDEATICFEKCDKWEISCDSVDMCIRYLREKNGKGILISLEKAIKDYIDRSVVEASRVSQKISELSKQLKNNGTNSGCPAPIWVPVANGEIPLGALIADQKAYAYFARAYFRNQVYRRGPKYATYLMPGKIRIEHPPALIPVFLEELRFFEYEVLVIPSEAVEWLPFNNSIPENAIIGGYEEHLERENIYIGRDRQYGTDEEYGVGPVMMDKGIYKLTKSYRYGGYTSTFNEFEILVLKRDPNCRQT